MKHIKKLAVVLGVVGGVVIGEYAQPYESISQRIEYYNVPIAKDFPLDPWNYKVQRELQEREGKTYQTLYLVNEVAGIHKKIDEDGCTCGVGNSIDDALYDAKNWIGEKVQAGKEWVKKQYEGD